MILKDLLKPNLDIVFCGTAVSKVSDRMQAYYAGPGNQFYPVLYRAGFTKTLLKPEDYEQLLEYNIGLTDLVKFTSGNDNVLNKRDYDVLSFKNKVQKYQPQMVCFNGKGAAAVLLYNNHKKTKTINYGFLPQTIGSSKLFVAPSTSGQARSWWDESVWFGLKSLIK